MRSPLKYAGPPIRAVLGGTVTTAGRPSTTAGRYTSDRLVIMSYGYFPGLGVLRLVQFAAGILQRPGQLRGVQWLGEVLIETGLACQGPILCLAPAGHGHEQCVPPP